LTQENYLPTKDGMVMVPIHRKKKKKATGGHSSQPRQLSLPIIIDRFVGLGQDLKNKTYSKTSSTPARNVLC